MSCYQPPYTITHEILNRVAAISEAIGRLSVLTDQARDFRLRRINRIRTIHGSLANTDAHPLIGPGDHGSRSLYSVATRH